MLDLGMNLVAAAAVRLEDSTEAGHPNPLARTQALQSSTR
jgi:hypothetical protein